MAYVGNTPRQVEGLSGQQDGARAAGNDGPLVLTGARLSSVDTSKAAINGHLKTGHFGHGG